MRIPIAKTFPIKLRLSNLFIYGIAHRPSPPHSLHITHTCSQTPPLKKDVTQLVECARLWFPCPAPHELCIV